MKRIAWASMDEQNSDVQTSEMGSLVRGADSTPKVGWRMCVGWLLLMHDLMGSEFSLLTNVHAWF